MSFLKDRHKLFEVIILILFLLMMIYIIAAPQPAGEFTRTIGSPIDGTGCITEICDGKDNDCDKQVDEGDICSSGQVCIDGECQITQSEEEMAAIQQDLAALEDLKQFDGYIVELVDEPILIKEAKGEKSTGYATALAEKQAIVKTQIKGISSESDIKDSYKLIFNGLHIDGITAEEADYIEKLSDVKKVYKNYRVKATLNESVPIIRGDDLWSFCQSGQNCVKAMHGNWWLNQDLTLEPLTEYHLSYWTKAGNYPAGTRVVVGSAEDEGYVGQYYMNSAGCGGAVTEEWSYQECTFTTPFETNNEPKLHVMVDSDAANESEKLSEYNYVDNLDMRPTGGGSNIVVNPNFESGLSDWNNWGHELVTGFTGEDLSIAIIDTGVDYTHPALGGCMGPTCKVKGGWDFVHIDSNPMDDNGHGTHCAGIAAGKGVLFGVAPDADIYAYKVLDSMGSGNDNNVIAAIEMAMDPDGNGDTSDHHDIISMSLGVDAIWFDDCYEIASSTAVDNAVDAGVVVLAAAGNNGPDEMSIIAPGCARNIITVGGSTKSDYIYDSTSIGPTKDLRIKPDVIAPAVNICGPQYNSWLEGQYECTPQLNGYIAISGTSMATPHVAGAVALIKTMHPDWSPDEIKMALRSTGQDLGYDLVTQGYGRIDVYEATSISQKPPISKIETSGHIPGEGEDILGTAKSSWLSNYVLDYGYGRDPSAWTTLTSSDQVAEGVLYSNWNEDVPEGEYTLRLRVTDDRGYTSEDRTIILIDNIVIDSPYENEFFPSDSTIDIVGSITGRDFIHYYVEYGEGESPVSWSTTGITLTNGGNAPIHNGLVATWDVNQANIHEPDTYTIRFTSIYSWGSEQETLTIYLDPDLKDGWPIEIGVPITTSPVVGDVDNDGSEEIIFSTLDGWIHMFTVDGIEAPGWPVDAGNIEVPGLGNAGLSDPSLEDIDGNGDLEIIYYITDGQTNGMGLYIMNHDGTEFLSKSLTGNGGTRTSGPIVFDMDNDGDLEILFALNHGGIFVTDHNGNQILPGFAYDNVDSGISIGNFDEDDEFEFVFSRSNEIDGKYIEVLNMNGLPVDGWPVNHVPIEERCSTLRFLGGYPIVTGDIDNDNKTEIITSVCDTLYAYNNNGSVQEGYWPAVIPQHSTAPIGIGDTNGDGYAEIFFGCWGNEIFGYTHIGIPLIGWPNSPGYPSTIKGSPNIVNVGGSKRSEVIFTTGSYHMYTDIGKVIVRDTFGTDVHPWPKSIPIINWYSDWQPSPVSSDIDRDGLFELLVASTDGTVYIWEMESEYAEDEIDWAMKNHDEQHTSFYSKIPKVIDPINYSNQTSNYTFTRITHGGFGDVYPVIHDNQIIWDKGHSSGFELHLYDLSTDVTTSLTPGEVYKTQYHDISDGTAVWQMLQSSINILGYDTQLFIENQITNEDGYQVTPSIYENMIIWSDFTTGNGDLYVCNLELNGQTGGCLETDTKVALFTDSEEQWYPDMGDNIIVWQDDRNGNWDIYGYSNDMGGVFPIEVATGNQERPRVYGDYVVWQDDRNGNWDIYMYSISTEAVTQITTDPADQELPHIHEGTIVWQDDRSGDYDIYAYYISSHVTDHVTVDDRDQINPSIHSDKIVWQDFRNENWDIYMTNKKIYCSNGVEAGQCSGWRWCNYEGQLQERCWICGCRSGGECVKVGGTMICEYEPDDLEHAEEAPQFN